MKSLLFPAGGCTGDINDGSRYCTAPTSEPRQSFDLSGFPLGTMLLKISRHLVIIWAAFPIIHRGALGEVHSATQVRTVGPSIET